ncbi:MAG: LptE family protein [Planctomycetota bacterium]
MTRWIFVVLLAATAGCGYSSHFELPDNIQRVAVPIFENKTLYRDLEYDLTAAVKQEIQARSKLEVTEVEGADAVLSGVIIDYSVYAIRTDQDSQTTEYAVVLTFDAKLEEQEGGKILFATKGRRITSTYVVARGEDETTARRVAFARMARQLVALALESW